MKATGQKLLAVVPFELAFSCDSQRGAPISGTICSQGYIFACENLKVVTQEFGYMNLNLSQS